MGQLKAEDWASGLSNCGVLLLRWGRPKCGGMRKKQECGLGCAKSKLLDSQY
jgi:hypothetical protein